MVDAARQMLDELMGRNRNLDPSEASRKIDWEDPEYCQYFNVMFCPHDLFVNTRADLGPCNRIHDEEARRLYEETQSSIRKQHYEDEFLRFCNTMLNDVDRKIIKGKQRLQLMNRDKPGPYISKYQEQLNTLDARIKKLLSEAEEAGIRGDVDQAQDLMIHCERLREERDVFVLQHESISPGLSKPPEENEKIPNPRSGSPKGNNGINEADKLVMSGEESMDSNYVASTTSNSDANGEKRLPPWMQDGISSMNEKQMEVCETCGAFLIVGDAQQRIEDHLMGKQHLGYSKLRKAVAQIYERRNKEREEAGRRRNDERIPNSSEPERRRDFRRDFRGHSRDFNSRKSTERHRHHSNRSHRETKSHSRSRSHHHHRHSSRDRRDRSRSRSRSRY